MNHRLFILPFLAIAVCLVSAAVGAAEDVNITLEGHLGGVTYATAVSGNYLYVGQGQDLVVLDISNPAQPSELDRIRTGDIVRGINFSGSYAYVADENDGLLIFDISNPAAPVLTGVYDTEMDAAGVAVSGSYAYVANNDDGLLVIDISNPTAPVLTGVYDTAIFAMGVTVSGSYAYVADVDNGLVIVDISNPAAPVLVGAYDTAGANGTWAWGVAVSGSYAYVADGEGGLVIVDISDPAAPTLAGDYDTGWAYGVAVSGSYAYVAAGLGIMIVDISNPAAPVLVGNYSASTLGQSWGVVVSGSYAYVADILNGLVIVDISDPAAPTLAGDYDAGWAYGVAVSGSYAYVANILNGLVIVDISNPAAPSLAGSYDTVGRAWGVAVSGSHAYVADILNGLVIVDISNPAAPVLAGGYDTVGSAWDVAVSGSHAYVADGSNGLLIVDISDPAAPVFAGSYDAAGHALGVAVSDNYAYVADGSNGLLIVDISDPAAPVFAGSYDAAGYALGVAVSGSYAYVADGLGIMIVDISNPAAPVLAGSYDTGYDYAGYAGGVAISGSYAYVADQNEGLLVIDINNPAAPVLAGSYDTAGTALGVAVSGNYAYVADDANGLVILRTDASGTTTPVHNINKGTDYTTIQVAIDNATPGDEIHVDSGTYYENVVVNKRLTLRGIDTGAGMPVVDAGGSGSAITLNTDGIRLEGFVATNAGSYPNAGIKVISSFNTFSGNTVSNNNGQGIYLLSSSNNVISENKISNNGDGIYLESSSFNTLSGNTVSNNDYQGFLLEPSSNNNTISDNTASYNGNHGIVLGSSSNNRLSGNTASNNNGQGILLESSNDNLISNNTALNNVYYGIFLYSSSNNIFHHNNLVENTAENAYDNGNNQWDSGIEGNHYSDYQGTDSNGDGIGDTSYPIPGGSSVDNYPLMNQWESTPTSGSVHNINKGTDYTTIQASIDDASPGDEIHVDSGTYYENVVVNKTLILIGNSYPIINGGWIGNGANDDTVVITADGVIFEGFNVTNGGTFGIVINSDNNIIKNNIITYNRVDGSYISGLNNTLQKNRIFYNNGGITLSFSSNNTLIDNNVSLNEYSGIKLSHGAEKNEVINNIILYNGNGIIIEYSSNNTVSYNDIKHNLQHGFLIWGLDIFNNKIFHNNFNNTVNVVDDGSPSINEFDNGYPFGGNYWSDYSGTDLNGDGIGDTPYPIPGGNSVDNYPLMAVYTPPTNTEIAKILFQSMRDGNEDIYVMDEDGSNQIRLTQNAAIDAYPVWSPDNQKIAFVSNRNGDWEIFSMNTDGNLQSNLTRNPANDGYISWSPDSQKIVFASDRDSPTPDQRDIYVMNADGNNVSRRTNHPAEDVHPAWSSDGQKIAFASDREGNREIYVMNTDGTNVINLTNYGGAYDDYPAWSPDGTKIAFASNRDSSDPEKLDIFVMNIDGNNVIRLTSNTFDDRHPAWSSDGSKITFVSNRDGNREIYVMKPDGTEITRLTNQLGDDQHPSFSPATSEPILPTIAITSPNGGEEWQVGTTQTIQWSYTGNLGPGVEIEIFNSSGPVQTFTYVSIDSGGSGSYQWLIPDNIVSGTDYQVKITVIGSAYSDTSGHFTISALSSGFTVGQGASPAIEQLFKNAYNRNGGVGELGDPESDVHEAFGLYQVQNFPGVPGIPGGVLMYNSIQNNVSYIHGAIWERYYIFQDKAKLGPVKEDEKDAAPSQLGTTGRYSKFENGTIHWISDETGANENDPNRGESFVTYGDLDKLYTDMGGTYNNWLGFPVMDQEVKDGHGYCEFEGGHIEWDDTSDKYVAKSTSPLIDIIKQDVIFEGIFHQDNYGTYPMIMEIQTVNGLEFDGILHWPTLGDSKTKFRGKIDSSLNQIWFTQFEQTQGSSTIVLNCDYYAEFENNILSGYWNWPNGENGGTFSLTPSSLSSQPKIDIELQRKGKQITKAEMGKSYDFIVKMTNLDQKPYYYSLGIDQVGHDIPFKTWNPMLNLKNSNVITQFIEPAETKEYRFTFKNNWKWLDDLSTLDVVSDGMVDAGAALIENPTTDLLLLTEDVVDTVMLTVPEATKPIRTVNIDFEPNQLSTNSIKEIDDLKKSVTVEIPYTNVKVSSFAMSLIWTWSGNTASLGLGVLTGGPVLDVDLNYLKKIGKYATDALFTFNAQSAYLIAADPINDFKTVVEVEPILLPEIDLIQDNQEKELISLYLELASIHRAFEKSYIRYAGASEAEEPYYMVLQLEACKEYSIQLTRKMEDIQRLHKTIFNDVEYMNEEQILAIQNDVSLNGLNQIEIDIFTREGHEELIQYKIQRILNADPTIYTDPSIMHTLLNLTTQSFIMNSEELMKEINIIKLDQLDYLELTATPQEIEELENLKLSIQNGLDNRNSYEELNLQIQLMILKSNELIDRTNNIVYLEYYIFASESLIDNINTFEPYNITFLPPITTMGQYSLTDGSTLPIKFTARDSTTDEFIYDDTVNVTITNSTGHLLTYFINGTGTDSVFINPVEEQYIASFPTQDYSLNVGETYAITATFGESNSLRGYAIAHFTLIDGTPPSPITKLQSTPGTTWITWTWTNPPDPDFNHTEIYLNNIFQTITSAWYYNATDLTPGTEYTISARTVDISGNVNQTWMNDTATTLTADTEPPAFDFVNHYPTVAYVGAVVNVSATVSDESGVADVTMEGVAFSIQEDGIWTGSIVIPADAAAGEYVMSLTADDAAGNSAESTLSCTVVNPVGGIAITSTPKPLMLSSGTSGVMNVKLVSSANFDDIVEVTLDISGFPDAYAADLSWFNRTSVMVQVPAGQTVLVPFDVSIPAGVSGYKVFKDSARSLGLDATSMDTGVVYVT